MFVTTLLIITLISFFSFIQQGINSDRKNGARRRQVLLKRHSAEMAKQKAQFKNELYSSSMP